MFTTYWEMQFNPFSKEMSTEHYFESEDFQQAMARLNHVKEIKGIGLFTGNPGTGKTSTIKKFMDSLNPSLFKCVYLPLSTVTVMEFYRSIAFGIGIVPSFKKIDMFNSIQERIVSLSKDRNITTVIAMDEGQYLHTKILNDLKILLNFHMDSKNYAAVILSGLPTLSNALAGQTHEALTQRIVINYTFSGLSKTELADYIATRLKACGVHTNMFTDSATAAIWGCSSGCPRLINNLAEKCLLLGFQKSAKVIDNEIVMLANNEISLI
jgi:type II secretory pathway predicted ATPase ExeA